MTKERSVISFLKAHEAEMFALLKKMVLIQSSSYNKEGVDRVARLIESTFTSNNVLSHTMGQTRFGNHLVVESLCRERFNKSILVVGHMDTVFPQKTDFNWYREGSTKCYGPGVIDMKGGLTAGIFALKALDSVGLLKKIPITFVFNSDEEVGSPSSKDLIIKEAKKSALAFVLECGGLAGEVVTGRKGNLSCKLDIMGRAGHAASANKDKKSAVLELAYKIIDFESVNDFEKGITVNVGKIDGGIGPNTVAEHAAARIDVRFKTHAEEASLKEKMYAITAKENLPQTKANLEIRSERPPMEQNDANRKLFQTVKKVAERLNISVKEEFRSGVSDANVIAAQNIPVLDGLGPSGANDHSSDEYMLKESLLQRSTLLAAAIMECRKKYKLTTA